MWYEIRISGVSSTAIPRKESTAAGWYGCGCESHSKTLSGESTYRCWTAAGQHRTVQCASAVLDAVGVAAREGFTRFPHGGVEVGGILLGALRGDTVRITEARPLPIEYARGAGFSLSEADQDALQTLIQNSNGKVAGWYVSHTRRDLTPNPSDIAIFDTFLSEPWHVYMIVKPVRQDAARIAVYCRGDDGVLLEYTECDDVPGVESPGPQVVEMPAPPLFAQASQQRSNTKYWAGALAVVACAGLAWYAAGGVKQAAPPVRTAVPAAAPPVINPAPLVVPPEPAPAPQVQAAGQRQRKAKRVRSRKRHPRKSKSPAPATTRNIL